MLRRRMSLLVLPLLAVNELGRRHDVLGQSTGLVRANAGGRTERFDALKVFDEDLLCKHALGSKGKADGNGGQQTLWNVSNDDSDHEDEVLDDGSPNDETEDKENDTEGHGNAGNNDDKVVELR